MVSIRVYCYLLIFFMILQLHAKVSNANFNSQVPEVANNEDIGAISVTEIFNRDSEDIIENRKVLKRVNVKVKANKKNGLEIESKETVKKRKNKKRLTITTSLTADYRDPGHHPPRHN